MYVSPYHTFSTFTTVKIKEIKHYKINVVLIIWVFHDSGKRDNYYDKLLVYNSDLNKKISY